MDLTQFIVTVLSSVVPIVLAIVGATWFLATRFAHIDVRLALLEQHLLQLGQRLEVMQNTLWMHGQVLGIFAGSLQRLGGLTPADITSVTQLTSSGLMGPIGGTVAQASQSNPITKEEGDRVLRYAAMAEAGESFTEDQVQDLFDLSSKLVKEVPTDPGAWRLATVAAFLFGLYMTGKRQGV